jgi:hypothetical protein
MADLFQDVFGLFGPNKWFWVSVVDQNIFIDRRESSGTLLKTPRRIRLRVISPNHRSTRFTHEELVGVKCK